MSDVVAQISRDVESDIRTIPKPEGVESPEWQKRIETLIKEQISERTKGSDQFPDALMVSIGGVMNYFSLPLNVAHWAGPIMIAPVARLTERPMSDKSEGFAFGDVEGPQKGGEVNNGANGIAKGAKGGTVGGKGEKPGGFAYSGEGAGPGESMFPSEGEGVGVAKCDSPHKGEPSLDDLDPTARSAIHGLMAEIAFKLQIPTCKYPARFCLTAAGAMRARAHSVTNYSVDDAHSAMLMEPSQPEHVPNVLDFRPVATPAMQFLRHLAGVTPRLSLLSTMVNGSYKRPEVASKFQGPLKGNIMGWIIDFSSEFHSRMKLAVADMFVHTTRVVFGQLTFSSKKQIAARLARNVIEQYSVYFERLVRAEITPQHELHELRRVLILAAGSGSVSRDLGSEVLETWRGARGAFLDLIHVKNPFADSGNGPSFGIVKGENGVTGIRDSHGHVWTLMELDRAIALSRDISGQIDPLAKQLTNDPKIRERFAAPNADIKMVLKELLGEMSKKNDEMRQKNRSDWQFAFSLPPVETNYKEQTVPGTGYAMGGLHRLAHEMIAEFFGGDLYYTMGVGHAMRRREGWETYLTVTEMTSIIVLSILCPPLGTAVGIGWASYHEYKTNEKLAAWRSLIDPEMAFQYGELEAELFAGDLGLILSFLPAGRLLGKLGLGAGKRLLAGEVHAAGRFVARQATRRFLVSTLRALEKDLFYALVTHLATFEVVNELMGKMVSPVMQEIRHQHLTLADLERLASEVMSV